MITVAIILASMLLVTVVLLALLPVLAATKYLLQRYRAGQINLLPALGIFIAAAAASVGLFILLLKFVYRSDGSPVGAQTIGALLVCLLLYRFIRSFR